MSEDNQRPQGPEAQSPGSVEGLEQQLEERRRSGGDTAVAHSCLELAQAYAEQGSLR